MKTVTVSELKRNPSAYFQFVRAGLSVLVLSRNKPVAILKPVVPEDDEGAFRDRLIALGIARGPKTR